MVEQSTFRTTVSCLVAVMVVVEFTAAPAAAFADDETVGDTVDRKSASFWIYGKQGLDATIQGGTTEFVGVLYAPSDVQGPGYGVVEITDHATVYGGIAAGGESVDLDVQANVYRDKALESTNPLEQTTTSSYVTFIHVTKNEITVTED